MADYNLRRRSSSKTKKQAIEVAKKFIPEFTMGNSITHEYKRMLSCYQLYNNVIDQREFEPYCNPLGISTEKFTKKVKPYNKANTYINVLLGEELQRKDNLKPILISDKAIRDKNRELVKAYKAAILQELEKIKIRLANEGLPEEEIEQIIQEESAAMSLDELAAVDFMSEMEIMMNKILQYAHFKLDIPSLKNDGFFHALVSGTEVVYVGEELGQPVIKVLNPLHTFYEKSPPDKYIQNGSFAGHVSYMSTDDVVNRYGSSMTKKELERMESGDFFGELYGLPNKKIKYHREKQPDVRRMNEILNISETVNQDAFLDDVGGRNYNSRHESYHNLVEVVHIVFKWATKVAFLTTLNEYGDRVTTIIDASYPKPEYAESVKYTNKFGRETTKYTWFDQGIPFEIEYDYIPVLWETTRIDKDIYVETGEVPNQIHNPNNPFDVTLPYYGMKYSATNAENISVMGRMKPLVFMYMLAMHQMGKLVARNHGPVRDIDTSQIDPAIAGPQNQDVNAAIERVIVMQQEGWNIYNSMLNAEGGLANSRRQPGTTQSSATRDILEMSNLLSWLEVEIGRAAGISPQRVAQFSSNTNVSDNQQALAQSSHITEIYFHKHNKLWAEILSGYLVLFRKWAKDTMIREGKSDHYLQYILPNETVETLKLTQDNMDNEDFGLFVASDGSTNRYLDAMERMAVESIHSQSASMVAISKILKARHQGISPEGMEKMLETYERERQEREASMQEQQQQLQMQIAQEESRRLQVEHEYKMQLEQLKADLEMRNDLAVQEKKNEVSYIKETAN